MLHSESLSMDAVHNLTYDIFSPSPNVHPEVLGSNISLSFPLPLVVSKKQKLNEYYETIRIAVIFVYYVYNVSLHLSYFVVYIHCPIRCGCTNMSKSLLISRTWANRSSRTRALPLRQAFFPVATFTLPARMHNILCILRWNWIPLEVRLNPAGTCDCS